MVMVAYSIAGKNYEVNSEAIGVDDMKDLSGLAAQDTKSALLAFVTILALYPNSAFKILPPDPLPRTGPYAMPDDDTLDMLGMDTVGIIALAMLICLQIEGEMRKMGLEMSQEQQKNMIAEAARELQKALDTNKSEFTKNIIGAVVQFVNGLASGVGGGASIGYTLKGLVAAASAKKGLKDVDKEQEDLDKIRKNATSEGAYKDDLDKITDAQTRVTLKQSEIDQTKKSVNALRKKVVGDDDPAKRAADEACELQLKKADEELQATKKVEQDAAKELKQLDDVGPPDGVDPDVYRATLERRLSDAKDDVALSQAKMNSLLDDAKANHPAAAASHLERNRDAIRSEIEPKEVERIGLEKELAELDTREKSLREELSKRTLANNYDNAKLESELLSVVSQKARLRPQLDARKAEIADLRSKEAGIDQQLDALAAARKAQLVDDVQTLGDAVRSSEDEIAELKARRDSAPEGSPERNLLESELATTERRVVSQRDALKKAEEALESHDRDFDKLRNAETRLRQQQDEIPEQKYELEKLEKDFAKAKYDDQYTFAEKQKQLDDKRDAAEIKDQEAKSATERAAAWRTLATAIGTAGGAFLDLAKAAADKEAADLRAQGQNIGRLIEILQIAQGIWASLGDNSLQYINGTRDAFMKALQEAIESNLSIARKI